MTFANAVKSEIRAAYGDKWAAKGIQWAMVGLGLALVVMVGIEAMELAQIGIVAPLENIAAE